jgi:hypothetical protein
VRSIRGVGVVVEEPDCALVGVDKNHEGENLPAPEGELGRALGRQQGGRRPWEPAAFVLMMVPWPAREESTCSGVVGVARKSRREEAVGN